MWPTWLKSPTRARERARARPSLRPLSFSCSSFKDVQTLCETDPQPSSPQSPSFIFRRNQISHPPFFPLHRRHTSASLPPSLALPNGELHQGVVVYYSSLRVIRKTFEDCRAVKCILRGFRVFLDERDVSMDESFLRELQAILGRKWVSLPMVFIGGVLVGGAEEIVRLHDSGELRDLIQRLPKVQSRVCDLCVGLRFVLCGECHGSHKVYREKCGFQICTKCNINGLIRCPSCFSMHLRHTRSPSLTTLK